MLYLAFLISVILGYLINGQDFEKIFVKIQHSHLLSTELVPLITSSSLNMLAIWLFKHYLINYNDCECNFFTGSEICLINYNIVLHTYK